MAEPLRKSEDRKICGVCSGLAEYLDMDPTVVRALWLLAFLVGLPFAALAYIVLAALMPD